VADVLAGGILLASSSTVLSARALSFTGLCAEDTCPVDGLEWGWYILQRLEPARVNSQQQLVLLFRSALLQYN
jgi:hypothetical protein